MKLGQKSFKNLIDFLGDLKTPKFRSEINWPLANIFAKVIFRKKIVILKQFWNKILLPASAVFWKWSIVVQPYFLLKDYKYNSNQIWKSSSM